jgi:hypothetical protein
LSYQDIFGAEEWNLLLDLPQNVIAAASAAESDSTRRTLAEGVAGLDAIAEGRGSGNPLVETVAGKLVRRLGDPAHGADSPIARGNVDANSMIESCLARVSTANDVLRKVSDGDAGAYRHWLVSIAESVVSAATTGGKMGVGGEQVTAAERAFVARLGQMLGD